MTVLEDTLELHVITDIDECDSSPCEHHGTCNEGLNMFTCGCTTGYTGIVCETDVNECESSPCENGGTCIDAVNGFICNCAPGYTGTICETEVDECESSPCQNGGSCEDSQNSYTCHCENRYFGNRCQTGNFSFGYCFYFLSLSALLKGATLSLIVLTYHVSCVDFVHHVKFIMDRLS